MLTQRHGIYNILYTTQYCHFELIINARWCQWVVYFINLESWNDIGNLLESFKWHCCGISISQRLYVFCLDWSENKFWSVLILQAQDSFKSRQNRRISIFLYAQFDYWLWYYGSWLLWWFFCEYCVNNFLTSMQNIVGGWDCG